jgi:hypothetical protein
MSTVLLINPARGAWRRRWRNPGGASTSTSTGGAKADGNSGAATGGASTITISGSSSTDTATTTGSRGGKGGGGGADKAKEKSNVYNIQVDSTGRSGVVERKKNNPARRHTHSRAVRQRKSWDGSAIRRILNSSAGQFFGERGGGNMAKHYHRRRSFRNPNGGGIVWAIGAGAVGAFATRAIPQAVAAGSNTGIMGYAMNAAVAVGGGWLLKKWKPAAGMGWLIGGGASLLLRVYQDYTTGAGSAGSSDGSMGLYIGSSFVVPTSTAAGNPMSLPSYNFAGQAPSIAAGVQPASAAAVSTAIGPNAYSRRMKGRFTPS